MAEPAITEPGQAVTPDVQSQMMSSSDILVAVPDGNSWKVTNLCAVDDVSNGVGDLSPVVARSGDNILVAWRQVASSNAVNVTDFSARDYIYYAASTDGGDTWTQPRPLYNGTSGSVKGIEAAMNGSGAAAVAFTLEGEGQDLEKGEYNQNTAYAVIDLKQLETEGYDPRYVVMAGDDLAENPQLATVELDAPESAGPVGGGVQARGERHPGRSHHRRPGDGVHLWPVLPGPGGREALPVQPNRRVGGREDYSSVSAP